jgi:hypothetical protein
MDNEKTQGHYNPRPTLSESASSRILKKGMANPGPHPFTQPPAAPSFSKNKPSHTKTNCSLPNALTYDNIHRMLFKQVII